MIPESFPKTSALLKRYFLTGLFVLTPLVVSGWILVSAIRALWRFRALLPQSWDPDTMIQDPALATLVNVIIVIGAALLLALGISALGFLSKHYLGRKVLDFLGYIIERIPVIRSVYSALDQLLKTIAAGGEQQFNRVVYVEYPRKGTWALAFVTGPARPAGFSGPHLNVYVPTTPNPTSGFHLIVPESETRESNMTVEDAFKTILSLGIAQPTGSRD